MAYIQKLLEKGKSKEALSVINRSTFYARTKRRLSWIYNRTVSILNQRDKLGRTPLHYIIDHPDIDDAYAIFGALIAAGSDINVLDAQGRTALHHLIDNSANKNSITLFEDLLDAQADINIPYEDIRLIHRAAAKNLKLFIEALLTRTNEKIDRRFIKNEIRITALTYACQHGHLDLVHWLAQKQASIEGRNCSDPDPTALQTAVKHGQYDIAAYLLGIGAKVNAVSAGFSDAED